MAWDALLDFLQDRDRGADLPRRAVAALKAIVLDEGCLHRMHLRGRAETFDGRHLLTLMHHCQCEAGIDAPTIDQDRARSALAVVATLLGSRQSKMLAQCIEKRGS